MKIAIKNFSVIYLALLLLLGSNIARAEQEGKDTDPKLLCKYTEVDTKRKPFKRRAVFRECPHEQEDLAYKEKSPKDALNKQNRKRGHLHKR
jgi:hypothetical protein